MFSVLTSRAFSRALYALGAGLALTHCGSPTQRPTVNPDTAAVVSVDRFQVTSHSEVNGHER